MEGWMGILGGGGVVKEVGGGKGGWVMGKGGWEEGKENRGLESLEGYIDGVYW